MKIHANFLDKKVDKDFLREYYLALDEYLMSIDKNGDYETGIIKTFYENMTREQINSPFYYGMCVIAAHDPILSMGIIGMMYNLMEEHTSEEQDWTWE